MRDSLEDPKQSYHSKFAGSLPPGPGSFRVVAYFLKITKLLTPQASALTSLLLATMRFVNAALVSLAALALAQDVPACVKTCSDQAAAANGCGS
ncbi:hypothetical protein AG1IA_08168 [Rhizoctonia solani AG-1 IA]|uniref:Uncharacterized protein n=1 Tax=Thanatephorus cucumeris (strain AG1-IA) TaxID=983506 RepID=L8WIT8_THACA|nr:hypothetical protein AG1IA_08168 [Rhizoctonia solani AG-1 IA]